MGKLSSNMRCSRPWTPGISEVQQNSRLVKKDFLHMRSHMYHLNMACPSSRIKQALTLCHMLNLQHMLTVVILSLPPLLDTYSRLLVVMVGVAHLCLFLVQ